MTFKKNALAVAFSVLLGAPTAYAETDDWAAVAGEEDLSAWGAVEETEVVKAVRAPAIAETDVSMPKAA